MFVRCLAIDMGASQSKTDVTPKIIPNQTPVQVCRVRFAYPPAFLIPAKFSQDVVDYLSDHLESPETTPERQISLDNRVRSRIQAELQALRAEEEKVQQEIHRALEKENLDRESDVGDGTPLSEAKNSATLIGNLEEIKAKVDRYQTRRQLSDFPFLKEAGEEVVSCYRCVTFSLFETRYLDLLQVEPIHTSRMLERGCSIQSSCGRS